MLETILSEIVSGFITICYLFCCSAVIYTICDIVEKIEKRRSYDSES